MRVRVIVNPKAGSGSAARRLPEILREIERSGALSDSAETRAAGDAARLVREAREEGIDCVAVLGGDGTFNEACQAYIDDQGRACAGPDLAVIPSGTGGDFRRTFQLGTSTQEAVARLMSSAARPVDLGVIDAVAHDGTMRRHAFVNITSFGMGGLTDRIVNRSPKWMGGRVAFFVAALRALAVYRNAPVRVTVDDEVCVEGPIVNVMIANGRYFGGGMKIAPDADPSDGLFDIVVIGDVSRSKSLSFTPHIYRGTHVDQPGVLVRRGRVVRAEPLVKDLEVLIDMDGETPGRLPLEARLLPCALRVRI
ncbi:MAG TPA: diacylglycerol kinase family protein [Polyangiaceae bacterium]|nr:diacylglycerol kinase family protein [Polyangiaceae bacterium]